MGLAGSGPPSDRGDRKLSPLHPSRTLDGSDEEGLSGEDDARLLARAALGDGKAFEILVFRHRGAVYRYARFVAAGASDAEDVLQETFLAAWRGAGGFAGRSSVRT